MLKWTLISKQSMEDFCKGYELQKNSVNDDSELLFEDIRLRRKLDEYVQTYFLPKLTEDELELFKRNDPNCFISETKRRMFAERWRLRRDVKDEDAIYVLGICSRTTSFLRNF